MAAEEDVFLKEVDEDLKRDETIAYFKKNGPWLAGAGALVISSVAGFQYWRGAEARTAAENAALYSQAVIASDAGESDGVTALLETSSQAEKGYAGLAGLRAGALLHRSGNVEEALAAYDSVIEQDNLPERLHDVARLRAAMAIFDEDPRRAKAYASGVSSDAFLPLAEEISALAALEAGQFDEAHQKLAALADNLASPAASRARAIAPVADAGRRGIALEATESEAEAFINSFSDMLAEELSADQAGETPEDEDAVRNEAADGDTPQ